MGTSHCTSALFAPSCACNGTGSVCNGCNGCDGCNRCTRALTYTSKGSLTAAPPFTASNFPHATAKSGVTGVTDETGVTDVTAHLRLELGRLRLVPQHQVFMREPAGAVGVKLVELAHLVTVM